MITSTSNSQIKYLSKLMLKSKARKEDGVFVVEGMKMFLETPDNLIKNIYISQFLYDELQENVQKKLALAEKYGADIEIVSDSVFKSVSDTVTPQGIMCIVRQPQYSLEELVCKENPMFIVLEDLQDPGNLGTIMRTAEGAGVTAVVMNKGTVDLFNPKVIRSTMGAIFRVPFVCVEDLEEVISLLKINNIKTYAAHLQDSVDYVNPSYIEGTAFLIGNEGNGLTEKISQKADKYVKIPMEGKVESLNASIAAALLMYEAYRQRRS